MTTAQERADLLDKLGLAAQNKASLGHVLGTGRIGQATETADGRIVTSQLLCGAGTHAAGVEDEVVVAVVKRTVFNNLILSAVDAAEAEGQVPHA